MGNKVAYRVSLGGFVLAFILMPFVGYKDAQHEDGGMSSGSTWLWIEMCIVLLVKTVAAIGGLTSALLMVGPSYNVYVPSLRRCDVYRLETD